MVVYIGAFHIWRSDCQIMNSKTNLLAIEVGTFVAFSSWLSGQFTSLTERVSMCPSFRSLETPRRDR